MQHARALLRHLSRLWIIVLRTILIVMFTLTSVAGVAFQWYAQSLSIVGQSGSFGQGIGLQEPIRITFSRDGRSTCRRRARCHAQDPS